MYKKHYVGLLIALLLVSFVADGINFMPQATPVKAQESGTLLMAVGNVRLREAPSVNASQIGLIPWGTIVSLVSVDSSGQWYQVNYNGVLGWAHAGWFEVYNGGVAPTAPTAASGPATSATASSTTATTVGTVMAIGNVVIRSRPSTAGIVLGQIGWGETAALLGVDASGIWYQINYNGTVGWAHSGWFEIVTGTALPSNAATSNTPSPNPASTPAQTNPSSAVPAPDGVTTLMAVGNVRFRTQPNTTSQVLGNIGWGTIVTLIAVDATGEWYQISYNGGVGWAHAGWFEVASGQVDVPAIGSAVESDIISPLATAPATENTIARQTPTTTVAIVSSTEGNVVRAVGNIRIRAAPSTNSQEIGAMGWGDAATLLGSDSTGVWYQIDFNGTVGWAHSGWMEITSGALPHTESESTSMPIDAGDRLIIPALGVDSALFEMPLVTRPQGGRIWYIDPWEPAVGHLQGTARPSESGNIVLGAHSEYPNGRPGIFAGLSRLNVGNTIILYANGVQREYRVVGKTTVSFDDLHVVYPTQTDRLTLLTCTGYSPARGIYLNRLIIYAEPVN
jgi:LPXTG-site transpeptidase (sortase) family protein